MGGLNIILSTVMIVTSAFMVSAMAIVFFFVCAVTAFLVLKGHYPAASNVFLASLFVLMFLAIKFDQYQNTYETYVLATLSLVIFLIASLVGYAQYQLVACLFLNVAAILLLYFIDIFPPTGHQHVILHIQNLTTSLLMVVVGSYAGFILISNQKQLLHAVESERLELDRMLRITELYTKRSLVKIISGGGDPTTFTPQSKNIAVFFCDIRQFTNLAETMEPIHIVRFLNAYFDRMNVVIQRHNGEIDKLIGDCIMASFADVRDATSAACEIGVILQKYNRERVGYGHIPIHIGIGISFGPVVQGNIGSREKMDYTVIGDVVNISSRLEALTRHYNVDIIVSEEVAEACNGTSIRMLDNVQVKGRAAPMAIYELYDHDPQWVKGLKAENQNALDKALDHYIAGSLEAACSIYDRLIKQVGPHRHFQDLCADPVLNFYYERCISLQEQFHAGIIDCDSWDGIHVFKEK